MKSFFSKNQDKQILLSKSLGAADFASLWKVNSQASSNQTFCTCTINAQRLQIYWLDSGVGQRSLLTEPNVKK